MPTSPASTRRLASASGRAASASGSFRAPSAPAAPEGVSACWPTHIVIDRSPSYKRCDRPRGSCVSSESAKRACSCSSRRPLRQRADARRHCRRAGPSCAERPLHVRRRRPAPPLPLCLPALRKQFRPLPGLLRPARVRLRPSQSACGAGEARCGRVATFRLAIERLPVRGPAVLVRCMVSLAFPSS